MLTLPIKKQWFDLIALGEKLEEYRSNNAYYDARFEKYAGTQIQICLRNGYSKNSPSLLCSVIPEKRNGARKEWGGNPEEIYWVLKILSVERVML